MWGDHNFQTNVVKTKEYVSGGRGRKRAPYHTIRLWLGTLLRHVSRSVVEVRRERGGVGVKRGVLRGGGSDVEWGVGGGKV